MPAGFDPSFINGLDPGTSAWIGSALNPPALSMPTATDAASSILISSPNTDSVMNGLNKLADQYGTDFSDKVGAIIQDSPLWQDMANGGAFTPTPSTPSVSTASVTPMTPVQTAAATTKPAKAFWQWGWDDLTGAIKSSALSVTVGTIGLVIIILSIIIVFYRSEAGAKIASVAKLA